MSKGPLNICTRFLIFGFLEIWKLLVKSIGLLCVCVLKPILYPLRAIITISNNNPTNTVFCLTYAMLKIAQDMISKTTWDMALV